MRVPAWRVFLVGGMAAMAVYFLLPDTERVAAAGSAAFHDAGAAAVLAGTRRYRPVDRWPWRLLATALLLLSSGDTSLFVNSLGDLADLCSLGAHVALTVGLLCLVRARSAAATCPRGSTRWSSPSGSGWCPGSS